ncbi:MAG: hypothetical protein KDC54_23180, partial [Lewinella sp.]|nr:hypothetical protein [Lewinella sp.]
SVIGLGLNVNETSFPATLPNPISLRRHLGDPLPLAEVRDLFFVRLEQRYRQLQANPSQLAQDYLNRLYRYGENATFLRTADGARFTGRIEGISAEGRLIITHPNGQAEHFDLKAIQFTS